METLEELLLNEGDWIAIYRFSQAQRKIQIDRVTKLYAFDSNGWKYHRKVRENGTIRAIDDHKYSDNVYYLLTSEAEVKYNESIEHEELAAEFKKLALQLEFNGFKQFKISELRNVVNHLAEVKSRKPS